MQNTLVFARLRNAGMIYVTDDVFAPNPWDTLATYFDVERALLVIP